MTREEFERYAIENDLVVWSKEMSKKAIKSLEQEVCEDCISREQAINEIEEWADGFEEGEYFSGKSVADAIRACGGIVAELPSVQPEVKTGHWIMHDNHRECSACKVWLLKDMPRNSFCPNCGCCMAESQESEGIE